MFETNILHLSHNNKLSLYENLIKNKIKKDTKHEKITSNKNTKKNLL